MIFATIIPEYLRHWTKVPKVMALRPFIVGITAIILGTLELQVHKSILGFIMRSYKCKGCRSQGL